MTQTPTDDPITRIRNHTANTAVLDIDAILRSGRRRRRGRQVAAVSGLALLATAVIGVTLTVGASGDHTRSVLDPASGPNPARGLIARHAVAGKVEILAVTHSGWEADAYLDTAGDICEGWVDPATSVMQGGCGDGLVGYGPTPANDNALTSPLLIEPEAAVGRRAVDAFGLTGPNTARVTVTNRGKPLTVVVSNVHTAAGQRAFLVRYPFPHVADWVDFATAMDANGAVVGNTHFVAPDTGQPSGPLPTPTR